MKFDTGCSFCGSPVPHENGGGNLVTAQSLSIKNYDAYLKQSKHLAYSYESFRNSEMMVVEWDSSEITCSKDKSYSFCPVCKAAVDEFFYEIHVDNCLPLDYF